MTDRRNDTLDADVIIVGGGVTGCAAAAALADGRRRILVLEGRPEDKPHKPRFAGELIHPTGTQVLDELGFLPALRAGGGIDVDGFAVIKETPLSPTLLPYREIPRTRPTGFAMEHRDLVEGMRSVVERLPGVTWRWGSKVEALLHEDQGRGADGAALSHGAQGAAISRGRACGVRTEAGPLRARLVLGCDGRHSKVRPQLKLPEASRLVSFTVAVRLLGAARHLPHQRFGHIFLGAWGPILIYPVSKDDARGCFDVTSELSGGTQGATALLRDEYARHLPPALRAALLDSLDRERPQIAANEAIRTDRVTAPGAAVVGDAGGCSHPLTATGMTVGFTDAQRIARVLAPLGDLSDTRKVDAALRRYEIERYRFVRARELLADALYEVFRAGEPGTRAIREGIFRYWDSSASRRARSMALLSGAESRPLSFLKEYLTVVGTSSSAALRGHSQGPGGAPRRLNPRERTEALVGLSKKGWEKFNLVLRDVRQEAMR